MDIRTYLKNGRLICDGAFGTYYSALGGKCSVAEKANNIDSELVKKIHENYIKAGAKLIRTNTFASNTTMLECNIDDVIENVRAGYRLAIQAAEGADVYVAGDIGPIPTMDIFNSEELQKEYKAIARTFVEEGAEILLFETFSTLNDIEDVIKDIKKDNDVFVVVQFCVNQYGYSNSGRSAKSLLEEASKIEEIDAIGFNCGVGPVHLYNIMEKLEFPKNKFISALPNAGYPKRIQNRMVFLDNDAYFTQKECEIAELGVDIIGGCCGTTPEYIRKLSNSVIAEKVKDRMVVTESVRDRNEEVICTSFMSDNNNKKYIAVELAPPLGADDEKIMDAANTLKNQGVDVLTFPDSPSGRTRADSILMAAKIRMATGMCVMPHICCRDKNAIAIRAQILGAYMNDIYNFLVVTGDPVPTMIRQSVKSVFNFDSVGMMHILEDMNKENFAGKPVTYGGVINYDKRNFDVEIRRVKTKMEAGAQFFFTQPIFTKEDADKVRMLKEQTGAKILCGIMPLVSKRNAVFIKNEMTGIRVTDEIVERFDEQMSREENENEGVKIAKDIIKIVDDFADGFYFTFPFNRVYLLEAILH